MECGISVKHKYYETNNLLHRRSTGSNFRYCFVPDRSNNTMTQEDKFLKFYNDKNNWNPPTLSQIAKKMKFESKTSALKLKRKLINDKGITK